MGSLIKQSGRFYVQFYDRQRVPQRKRVPLYVSDRRGAERRRLKLEADYVNGSFDPWTSDPLRYDKADWVERAVTVSEAKTLFIARKQRDGRKDETLRTYRDVVGRFVRHVGAKTLITSITTDDVDAFIRKPGVSVATKHSRYRNVKAFLRWCLKEDLITADPLRKLTPPPTPSKLPKSIAAEEVDLICAAARDSRRFSWMAPAIRFAFVTGLRSSEIARLRWNSIDRAQGLLTISEQKNGKESVLPLSRAALQVLGRLEDSEDQFFVFGPAGTLKGDRDVSAFRQRLSRLFTKLRKRAGIDRKVTFHSLRHGFATTLASNNKSAVVIKELCRHSSIVTTMTYVSMTNEHLRAHVDDVFS